MRLVQIFSSNLRYGEFGDGEGSAETAGLNVGGLVVRDEVMGDAGDRDGESLCERMRLTIVFVVCVSDEGGKEEEEENDKENMENMRQHSTQAHEEEDTEDAERMKNTRCMMHGTRSTCVDGVLGGSGTTCGRENGGVVTRRRRGHESRLGVVT
jgi:hypothetical protein